MYNVYILDVENICINIWIRGVFNILNLIFYVFILLFLVWLLNEVEKIDVFSYRGEWIFGCII